MNAAQEIITTKSGLGLRHTLCRNGITIGWIVRFDSKSKWMICFYDSCENVVSVDHRFARKGEALAWLESWADRHPLRWDR